MNLERLKKEICDQIKEHKNLKMWFDRTVKMKITPKLIIFILDASNKDNRKTIKRMAGFDEPVL